MSSTPANIDDDKSSKEVLLELEQELTLNNPGLFKGLEADKKTEILRSVSVSMTTLHAGPLPAPETLSAYDQIIPNGADRIMKMAENQQSHRMAIEKKSIGRNSAQSLIGQIFGLIIGLAGIGCGTWLASEGHQEVGGIIAGGTVVSLVSVFVLRKRSRR